MGGRRHALYPFAHLRDLCFRIPVHPNQDIDQLLPDNGKRLSQEAGATGE